MKITIRGIECEARPAAGRATGAVEILCQGMRLAIEETLDEAHREAELALHRAGARPEYSDDEK